MPPGRVFGKRGVSAFLSLMKSPTHHPGSPVGREQTPPPAYHCCLVCGRWLRNDLGKGEQEALGNQIEDCGRPLPICTTPELATSFLFSAKRFSLGKVREMRETPDFLLKGVCVGGGNAEIESGEFL